ncbi:MAG: Hsp20/alpha crystallin family protein [Burkholderiales bacterium]
MANLVRWDPFQSFPRMHAFDDSFDDLLRRFGRSPTTRHDEAVAIAVDVSEDDKAYTVKAEIPGVKKEDIGVSVDGNQVTIQAEVKKEKEEKEGGKVLRSERYYGAMYRSFTLPMDVDQAKADAQYADGVLQLVLPKKVGAGVKKLEVR